MLENDNQTNNFFESPAQDFKPASTKRWWTKFLLGFCGLFLVLLVALGFYAAKVALMLRNGEITPDQLFGNQQQVVNNDLINPEGPMRGPLDAKVVIVEFSDFQCPYCAQSYLVMKELMRNYGDQVLFVYRDFPIVSNHPEALAASLAGRCAHEQGKFWEMHDKIFENQEDLSEDNLKRFAVQIGLFTLQFNDCFDSGKYVADIEKDLQEGFAAGVVGTPTFFINGKILPGGAVPLNVLESIIISELSRQ